MNLQTMEDWLDTITKEAALKPFYADWLNDALFELALDFEFPTLKRLLPETVTVDDSTWVWPMPSDYPTSKIDFQSYITPKIINS